MQGENLTVTASVEIRELPDAGAQILETLPRGQSVTRLDDRVWNQTWLRVETTIGPRRYHGYVPIRVLARPHTQAPAPAPAPTPIPAIDADRLEAQMLDTLRGYGRRKMVAVLSKRRKELVAALATRLAEQFPRAAITTPLRQAHFIAQTSVETDFYNTMREYGDAARFKRLYEDNHVLASNLGNREPGDGALFRGRGLIQLTGRSNYTRASAALGLGDRLVEQPQLVEHDLNIAISAALWYWLDKKINAVCERSGTVDQVALAVSRAVNRGNPDHTGQPNHRDDRRLATLAAYEAFGLATS